jgi:hypothetical protein
LLWVTLDSEGSTELMTNAAATHAATMNHRNLTANLPIALKTLTTRESSLHDSAKPPGQPADRAGFGETAASAPQDRRRAGPQAQDYCLHYMQKLLNGQDHTVALAVRTLRDRHDMPKVQGCCP